MPVIYQGTCSRCGHETPVLTDAYVAVYVDPPVERKQTEVVGAVAPTGTGSQFAPASDPRFLALSHPAESSSLKGTGYSRADLLWQGRNVSVSNVVCRQCGTLFQRRRLTAPTSMGCGTALALGLVCGILCGIAAAHRSHRIALGLVLGLLVTYVAIVAFLMLIGFLARFYVRTRFSDRARTLVAESVCPHCQTDDATSIANATTAKCPACGQNTVAFKVAGFS